MSETGHQDPQNLEIIHELLEAGLVVELVEHHHHAHGVREVVIGQYIVLLRELAEEGRKLGFGELQPRGHRQSLEDLLPEAAQAGHRLELPLEVHCEFYVEF